MSQPQIVIDPDEAKRIEKNLILRDIYYCPTGYYSNPKFLRNACKKEGHRFYLKDVKDWLELDMGPETSARISKSFRFQNIQIETFSKTQN